MFTHKQVEAEIGRIQKEFFQYNDSNQKGPSGDKKPLGPFNIQLSY